MKSNGDLPNLGKHVVLKTVSPQILDKLRESGLTVCICCEFEGVAWLKFSPGLPLIFMERVTILKSLVNRHRS